MRASSEVPTTINQLAQLLIQMVGAEGVASISNVKLSFYVFSPWAQNVHLTKAEGMIPFIMQRDYGYDSYIISYKNGVYPGLKTDVAGLKMQFIRRVCGTCLPLGRALDALPFLFRNAKKIDVLTLHMMSPESLVVGLIYKILNKNGFVYLNMDISLTDSGQAQRRKLPPSVYRFLSSFASLFLDVIGVETMESFKYLSRSRLKRIRYIPNGIDMNRLSSYPVSSSEKDSLILHVGRIGTYQKASEVALETFARVAGDFPQWRLLLVGTIETAFANKLRRFLEQNKAMQRRIRYMGFLQKREELYKYYRKAKILFHPSRWEGFAHVPLEAAFFGVVPLGSDLASLREITDNGTLGWLCPVNDVSAFVNSLRYALSHEDELKRRSELLRRYVVDNYGWSQILRPLDSEIKSKMERHQSGAHFQPQHSFNIGHFLKHLKL